MLSPTPHNQRDDILEVSILDTINIPNRKDGSPRQPFFSALIPATEQRWQQQQTFSTPSSPQTFFFSVADRQEHAVKISLWDRKEDGTTDEHQKLLGECTLPLFYVGWQWVDAKLKVKAADGAQPSKYAASYLRTRMRFTRDSRSGGKSGDIPTAEEWEPRKEEVGTPKSTADRKKFWRHTRDLGKRDRKHNEFLMSQDIRAVGGPEYAENMDKTSVRQEMLLSQPVRTISINASDSSDDSDSDSPPPAKHGNGIGRRLSRDITKLRQLLTSTDTSHTTQQPLTQARSLSPKGSSAGGKKFWTTGRQSQVSLEVSKSVDVLPSVQSIDWSNGGGAQARTFSDGDMASLSPRKTKTKSEKKKEKKEKKNKEKEEKEKANGDGVVKRVKAVKKKQHQKNNKDKSSSGSFVKSKLGKKLKKKHDDDDDDNDNSKEEEGWERDSSSDDAATEQQSHHKHSDDGKKKKKHKHKRDKSGGAEGLESGVVVVVTEVEEESEKKKKSAGTSSGSGDEAVTVSSSSGDAPPVEEKQLKLAKKDKRKSKSGSSASAVHTSTTDKPAAEKKTKSPTKKSP
ncbi:uncharacterized protein ACA1_138330 [Acanthamoeba castellanii str. Neff]|uniref:C2 domain-containing protein n=1 Tax=Acanthamoeba castellanii (strain ATCC 30010 / Neff) TaxID=1257118 RepID=L8H205_ACACF|nr:uncharacterized protein ACA1_138330 [Acanthamoeba castellanii str. Neff]ELR18411.1 hypothetical protein ACA1_138330 [Acanthamoeba castellanii str. Neff]